jgi:hypothetical protein
MKLKHVAVKARRAGAVVTHAAQNGLAAFGLLVVVFLAFDGGRFVPVYAAQAGGMAFGKMKEVEAPPAPAAPSRAETPDPRQRAIAANLSRRYRVAADPIASLVSEAFAAGEAVGLDPLLIIAVIAIESRFNPIAESEFGAKGLMQVIPRFHMDKLALHGGEIAVLHPPTNIAVGAQILKEYVRRTGSLEDGLQMYAGALDDPGRQYAQKVMLEQQRLREFVARLPRAGSDA